VRRCGPRGAASPLILLAVVLVACVSPLGVVAFTGLASGPAGGQVEIADGGGRGQERTAADPPELAVRIVDDDTTTTTVATTPSTAAASSETTATTAPTTTAAPTTEAPTTTAAPTTEAPTTTATTAPPSAPPASETERVVQLVNSARSSAGCDALRIDDRLTAAAQGHSDDMAARDYFSHTSLDGRSFADRISAAGYANPGGENIAQGQRNAQAVHDAWMNSDGHRRNILNCSFTAIGVGLNTDAWTWTQNFGY
jgi:uncharacterized protein YkwD